MLSTYDFSCKILNEGKPNQDGEYLLNLSLKDEFKQKI